MTRAKLAEAGKWLGRRVATLGWFALAVVNASGLDDPHISLLRFLLRLTGACVFLMTAVYRTITHWHEDREDS